MSSAHDEQGLQSAFSTCLSTCRAPDEHRLVQWRLRLLSPQRRCHAAQTAPRRAPHRQQATRWLAGLQATSAICQPGRFDVQGVLPLRMIGLSRSNRPSQTDQTDARPGGMASASTVMKLTSGAIVSRAYCSVVNKMLQKSRDRYAVLNGLGATRAKLRRFCRLYVCLCRLYAWRQPQSRGSLLHSSGLQ